MQIDSNIELLEEKIEDEKLRVFTAIL